jgi:hypothetical protein
MMPANDANQAKNHTTVRDVQLNNDPSTVEPRWQYLRERSAVSEDYIVVLPLLVLGLLVFQLDRMNLASTLAEGYQEEYDIDQITVNLGNPMMFLGTFVLGIPFNLVLHRVGPRKWLAVQILVFGTVAMLQVLVKNRTGLLVTGSLLEPA